MKKRYFKRIFAAVLASVLALTLVGAVDAQRACTLTLTNPASDYKAYLDSQSIPAKVYRVASINKDYTYNAEGAFRELDVKNFKDISGDLAQNQALSAKALEIAKSSQAEATEVIIGTKTELQAGLYLLVTEPYNDNVNGHTYTYTSPLLISLPTMDEIDGTDLYDVICELKVQETQLLGSVDITKNLVLYSALQGTDTETATFVFQIDAVNDSGETVYSNVQAMTFTQADIEAGTKTLTVSGIPVGSTVTVTEVYSGTCYTPDTTVETTRVDRADEAGSVSFTNRYNRTNNSGSSVDNQFSRSETGGLQVDAVYDKTGKDSVQY